MPLFAQTIDLVDDPALIAQYEAHHRAVWPETLAALRRIGITGMTIWRTGTRLFMVFEAPASFNPATDFQSYAADPKAAEWDALMRRYQHPIPNAHPSDWWTAMTPIFHLQS